MPIRATRQEEIALEPERGRRGVVLGVRGLTHVWWPSFVGLFPPPSRYNINGNSVGDAIERETSGALRTIRNLRTVRT
jgi:hypothetical protein